MSDCIDIEDIPEELWHEANRLHEEYRLEVSILFIA